MMAQYVHPSKTGLFRIIRHGRQWRVLCEQQELGRHATPEAALAAARDAQPRLPDALEHWRFLAEPSLSGLSPVAGGVALSSGM